METSGSIIGSWPCDWVFRVGEIGDIICIISYYFVSDDAIGNVKEKILLLEKDNKAAK